MTASQTAIVWNYAILHCPHYVDC